MKTVFTIIFLAFITFMLNSQSYVLFEDYFVNTTLRIDYHHIGDSKTELFTIDKLYTYGIWAGSTKNLIDNFNNGKYYVKVYDAASNKLIFSKGFDSYFGEYQTNSNAIKGIKKAYHESVLIPLPKEKIKFSIEKRDAENNLKEIFSSEIDPKDISIIKDRIVDSAVKVFKAVYNGEPQKKVDVAIISEGYTANELGKFRADLEKFSQILFTQEPFQSNKQNFNIYGVYKPSEESGTDEPPADIFRNTVLNSTFNSLGSERYLLTEENKALHDLAAHVPYDALFIMVNHKKYGGGGIYNWCCTFTVDNQWHKYLFLHEFGHSFAGLADEYYTSDVAYEDFFKQTVEPVEPNITALLDTTNLKWEKWISPGIGLPSFWEKKEFEEMDYKWQNERRALNIKVAELKRNRAPKQEILKTEEEYNLKDKQHAAEVDRFLRKTKNYRKIGAFEGAGYSPKGLYRPMIDCIMFSKGDKLFCKICEEAILKVIQFYSE
ncbi:MAG: peptidase M64 [Ignavibacteria bacterium RIFOXYB2_FULL_35_12]|nr:MAG: peptidase M64 [Ignavibacteria bacterium GWF2_35_20]OGU79230.1 MAG: peptidase M64 [Ignavibacteria bacterium RIFOXYA2_FULL_35_9]OGU86298.1 MAG: peptidase M64 [Ignavibacteria bacterium RIFOXYA12_FULL_35_25]OGU87447.1 MAG: peptidase M64 [Ignavibacteria bacterium RIFOXYC12_FULL_35_11]OGU97604.1 MAG: peptidase M64 [Ignavibacteria bacterium RIFOXYB12_FULL_35_14]OGV00526.1 MAG: peptidase M64 [Ignavibacteria bacterium RIFOXYC2_FULL_35_16]OGV02357.1 MAG: peptidase M64 [Ignavibacteria bacterium 